MDRRSSARALAFVFVLPVLLAGCRREPSAASGAETRPSQPETRPVATTIRGRITAKDAGFLLAGVRVEAIPNREYALNARIDRVSAWSEKDGSYVLQGLEDGSGYWITVRARNGYREAVRIVDCPAVGADFALEPDPAAARLVGRVVDDVTGDSVESFNLYLVSGSAPRIARTGVAAADGMMSFALPHFQGGRFEYSTLAAGPVWLMAEAPGYASGTSPVLEQLTSRSRKEGIEIRLIRGATVKGRVVDINGVPIVGARVQFAIVGKTDWQRSPLRPPASSESAAGVTGPDGRFVIPNVPEGAYILVVRHPDFGPGESPRFDVPRAGDVEAAEIVLAPGAKIRGQVRLENGAPDPAAAVLLEVGAHTALENRTWIPFGVRSDRGARTDAAGRFEIDGLAPGQYSLWITRRNGKAQPWQGGVHTVAAGEVKDLQL